MLNQDELDLLDQYLDGRISREDFQRLQSLLRESAEARKTLRDLASIGAKLTAMAAADPATEKLLRPPAAKRSRLPGGERSGSRLGLRPFAPLAIGLALGILCMLALWPRAARERVPARSPRPVRAAVLGAITNIGLWEAVSARFEKATGTKVVLTYTGDREFCEDAFRKGEADLLAIHAGDDAAALVAQGFGVNLRPWTSNEMVIVGPDADPAGVKGMTNGAEALKKIAATQSPYLDFQGSGSIEVARALWKAAGIPQPSGSWVLKDEDHDKWTSLRFAQEHGTYVITGRLPTHSRKLPAGKMPVLVQGDPAMRRSFVAIEANPAHFSSANSAGAHALADFLLSPEIQQMLSQFGARDYGGIPYFQPVATLASTRSKP